MVYATHKLNHSRVWLIAVFFAVSLLGCASPEKADTMESNGVLSGAVSSEVACANSETPALWVMVGESPECIKYFHSGLDFGVERVQVFFHGDWLYQWLNGRAKVPSGYKSWARPENLQRGVDKRANQTKQPFIFMGRPGVFGSSGFHKRRRLERESEIINAALDELRKVHGVKAFALSGQSGGGHVVAALLPKRGDIVCAAISSGVVSVRHRSQLRGWGARDITGYSNYYDPINHIASIKIDPERRIFVIGDKRDTNVPFVTQRAYFEALEEAGHNVTLIPAKGQGDEFHSLQEVAISTAGDCLNGLDTAQIVTNRAAR